MSLTISLPSARNDYVKWAGIFVAASSGAVFCRFVYKVATDPIQVIWDLDGTVIASHLFRDKCAEKYNASEFPDYFDQIDDDFEYDGNTPNTRTWFRPYTKFTLRALSYFTTQHIFTAAQQTYTDNVTRALQEWTGNQYFTIIKNRDLYPPKHLSKNGKDIYEIIGTGNEKLLRRSIFFDDRLKYLMPHPENGVLVKEYTDIIEGKHDKEMLKWLGIIICCTLLGDVRSTLKMLNVDTAARLSL